jgi:hypothetical protein
MCVVPLLSFAFARRIAEGFLECFALVARDLLEIAILRVVIEFDRGQAFL